MTVEHRLRDALGPNLAWDEPSPDLFARVQASVAEDRRRRARRRRTVAAVVGGATAIALLLTLAGEGDEGRWLLEWWWLEGLVTVALSGLVVVLGPLIRRFGQVYVTDVFRATPDTGAALLTLMDIAYYLVFGAYVVMTTTLARPPSWGAFVGADQLWHETARAGGLLLLKGVLHGLNLLALPIVARLLALNHGERSPDQHA